MALEIIGKLVKVMNPVTGDGKNGSWTKQEFVLETFDQYPKKVCCSVWGDKVDALRRFQLGDDVRASINIESREYNERWYTEVRAWKLDPASAAPQASAPSYAPQAAPSAYATAPSASSPAVPAFQPVSNENSDFFKSDSETDDLPF
jgi:hypothetical protein